MRDKQRFFFYELFSIVVCCVFVSCNDDSLGEDKIGEVKKTVENLAKELKELKELGAKQLEGQSNIISKLGEEEARVDSEIQNLIGEEKKESVGVYDMLAVLKKPKEELTNNQKTVVESKVPSKIEELKVKIDGLIKDLFSVNYIGFLWYMKIEQNPAITPDKDLAAKTALKETLLKQLELIRKDPTYLRSAEAYLDKTSSIIDLAEPARLVYSYKAGVALSTPCLGVTAGFITEGQYRNALSLFESHRSAISCYLSTLSLTIAQAKLENGLIQQG